MKMNEVLIIKEDRNEFERFYNDRMTECGCTVLLLRNYRREKLYYEKGLFVPKLGNWLRLTRKFLAKYKLVILFEEPILYLYLKHRVAAGTKLLVWNWNISNDTWLRGDDWLHRQCENWTFDEKDAKKFGWKLNGQFYQPVPLQQNREPAGSLTAFSACVDRGRYPVMKKIREALEENGVHTDFYLVCDQPSGCYAPEDRAWLRTEPMPYHSFLEHTMRSGIVAEVVQEGQVGLTVRALEALFYEKKLITNNAAVRGTPIYHPDNVLIWEPGAEKELDRFLKKPYHKLPDEVQKQYTLETWLDHFMES